MYRIYNPTPRAAEPQVRKYRACLVDTSKMSPIKDFRLIYEPLNEENLFSEGDAVKGTVIITLTKETKVNSIFVKVKGDARVNWSKQSGGVEVVFKHHTRFFKDKEYLVKENAGGRSNKCASLLIYLLILTPDQNLVSLIRWICVCNFFSLSKSVISLFFLWNSCYTVCSYRGNTYDTESQTEEAFTLRFNYETTGQKLQSSFNQSNSLFFKVGHFADGIFFGEKYTPTPRIHCPGNAVYLLNSVKLV